MSREFLLWDHDGVLVDTERWYFEATREGLARLGVELSRALYLERMALGRSDWDLARERGVSDAAVRAARAVRDRRYHELLRTRDIRIDGADEVLEALARDHRMALVTTARRGDLEAIHGPQGGLLRHFEFVLALEDYPRAKPDPAPYLAALQRFGAAPAAALAIEDSLRGLSSACAAGIDCVIVRNEFCGEQDWGRAWRVVDGLRGIPGILSGKGRGPVPG